MNKWWRHFNRDSNIFVQRNVFEYAVCKIAATLLCPQAFKYVSILVEGVILLLQLGWVPPLFHQSPSMSLCRHYHNRTHHAEHTTRLILNRIKSSYLMKSRICEILCLPTHLFWNWEGASRAKLYKHDIYILRISQDFTKPLCLVITWLHNAYDVALQRKKSSKVYIHHPITIR